MSLDWISIIIEIYFRMSDCMGFSTANNSTYIGHGMSGCCSKNGKLQKRGKMNLIGRLQLSTERSKEEDNDGIVQLRILRVQVGDGSGCQSIFMSVLIECCFIFSLAIGTF